MKMRTYYDNQIVGEDYQERAYAYITTDKNRIFHEIASMLFEIQRGNEYYKIIEITDNKLIIEYTTYNEKKLTTLFEDIDFRLYN